MCVVTGVCIGSRGLSTDVSLNLGLGLSTGSCFPSKAVSRDSNDSTSRVGLNIVATHEVQRGTTSRGIFVGELSEKRSGESHFGKCVSFSLHRAVSVACAWLKMSSNNDGDKK